MTLTEISEDIQKAIKADPWFSNIDVVVEKKGDVNTQVDLFLKKMGICVVIEQADGTIGYNGPGLVSIPLGTTLTITEQVMFNRGPSGSRKQADEVLLKLIMLFNIYNGTGCLFKPKRFSLVNDMGGSLIYQLTGEVDAALTETSNE